MLTTLEKAPKKCLGLAVRFPISQRRTRSWTQLMSNNYQGNFTLTASGCFIRGKEAAARCGALLLRLSEAGGGKWILWLISCWKLAEFILISLRRNRASLLWCFHYLKWRRCFAVCVVVRARVCVCMATFAAARQTVLGKLCLPSHYISCVRITVSKFTMRTAPTKKRTGDGGMGRGFGFLMSTSLCTPDSLSRRASPRGALFHVRR